MPSFLHEALVELFRRRPDLAVQMLAQGSSAPLPAYDQVVSDSADLGAALAPELTADALLRVERGSETILAIVVEVQLGIDPQKRFSWPSYLVAARARHRCDALILVVTPHQAVATWAAQAISLGPASGFVLPTVIGPAQMPSPPQLNEALALPELAVLFAVAHGHDDDPQRAAAIAATAIEAAFSLPDHRAEVYYDIVIAALSDAAKEALAMIPENYQFQDEGLRRARADGEAIGISKGEAIGISKGEAIGISKGEAIGISKGEAIGISKGLADALLDMLDARGLALAPSDVSRIRDCADSAVLRTWLRRALVAHSILDVFA